jgi:hypothetical protein
MPYFQPVAVDVKKWRKSKFFGARSCDSGIWSDPGFAMDDKGYWAQVPRLTRGRTFFLRRQEESSQRRRRPWVGAGCAGSLRYSVLAGAAELGAAPLRQSSPFSRQPLRCSAPPKGPERRRGSTAMLQFWPVAVDGEKGAKIKTSVVTV